MELSESLIEIGIELSAEENLDRLLDMILERACELCSADAGTLYLNENGMLRYRTSLNKTIENNIGKESFQKLVPEHSIKIDNKSIAGWSAQKRKILNIEDVRKIKNKPYSYNTEFEDTSGYCCQSILTVPVMDKEKTLVGVFQLINKKEDKEISKFTDRDENIAMALASQSGVAIRNTQLTEDLKSARLETIFMLGEAAEYKDKQTGNHIKRVSYFSRIIAEGLSKSDNYIEKIFHASPLHDVGKIGIPDNILTKPGKLTHEEWKIMKTHTELGYNLMKDSNSTIIKTAAKIAHTHHEKWNGSGYPGGLRGEEIPLCGRIVALADFFDALSSIRPYRKESVSFDKIMEMIKKNRGIHFDPAVTDIFMEKIDRIVETVEQF